MVAFSSLSQSGNKAISSRAATLNRPIGGDGQPCRVQIDATDHNDNLVCNYDVQSLYCSAPLSFWLTDPAKRDSYTQTRCLTHDEIYATAGMEGNLCRNGKDDPSIGELRCNPGFYCVDIFNADKKSVTSTYLYGYLNKVRSSLFSTLEDGFTPRIISAIKKYTFDQDTSFTEPKGVCIPQAQTKVLDCGDLHQLPCTREGGKEFCFDPSHKIVQSVCQPCGADNQIGCEDGEGYAAKCNDPQKFSWGIPDFLGITCKSLPPPEQILDVNNLNVGLSFIASEYFGTYSLSTPNDYSHVKVSGSTDHIKAASKLFTNMTKSSLSSLFSRGGIDISIATKNRTNMYFESNPLTSASTATFTCNDAEATLPILLISDSVYLPFNNLRWDLFKSSQDKMVKIWNDCKFHFGTNTIKVQKMHMVFNNGGTDIVYDYDLTNAPNNEVKLTFTYNDER